MTMKVARRFLFAGLAACVVPSLLLAGEAEVRLRTNLAGGPLGGLTPSGHADFRARAGRARLNVQVEDVNLAAGTQVDVYVNDAKVGSISISAAPVRGGEFELNSQDGDIVPAISAGAMVVVKNGDAALLSGVLN